MEFMVLLTLEHWLNWLPMFLSGFLAFKLKSKWRWAWAVLLALLPLLALPGNFMGNRNFAILSTMFIAIGFFSGSFLGLLLQRKNQAAA
ncbi:hypothetical protein [Microvirga calopogonii]|uniref:hypothetical protein n=1 Tax=Microvirga calopogonii TaxID=2078013 RepID=UPI000E0CDDCC|nr:hypothetical protein [Microvirga calopogonii]